MSDRRKLLHWLLLAGWLLVLPSCGLSTAGSSGDSASPITAALGLAGYEAEAPGVEVESDCDAVGEPATETHRMMFNMLNTYRVQNGLKPLMYSLRLEEAADAHVRDCWERNFFDHINPDGLSPSDRALEAGFCHQYVGENIAAGQPTVERAMLAWENSPPHNANMLEPDFVYVGMGHFVDPNGRHYWGQLMAFKYP